MRRLLSLATVLATLGCGLVLTTGLSMGQMLQGIVSGGVSGGAPSFTGIGDTQSGAKGHWGSIAYSAATRGSNAYNICDNATPGLGTCKDIKTDATTGLVSSTQTVGSIGACGTGGNQCYIQTVYDDSGASFCTSAACDLGSVTARPKFVVNAFGTLPAIGCFAGTEHVINVALPNPVSGAMALLMTANFNAISSDTLPFVVGGVFTNGAIFDLKSGGGSTTQYMRALTGPSAAVLSTGTNYVLIGSDDGAGAGHTAVNGADTSGSAGTANATGSSITMCANGVGANPDGQIPEAAFYNANTFSNLAALYADMHTNAGF